MDKSENEEIKNSIEQMLKIFPKIIEAVKQYSAMSYLTPEEELEYQNLKNLLKKGLPLIMMTEKLLGDELYRNAVAYYYAIKEKALNGNEKAMTIYEDLAPDFEQILLLQTNKN